MMDQYKYFAFVSYSSSDVRWGKQLQKKLEHFRMPSILCSEHGWARYPIRPVFFAPTDIQPGPLSAELQQRLKDSKNLIVICSPRSAKSKWVGREIEFFHSLGRSNSIHLLIVDGIPHSGDESECLNPAIENLGIPELLAANINERVYSLPWLNRERAYIQLISKLLNVEFDSIWNRHRRRIIQQAIAACVSSLVIISVIISIWVFNQPVNISVGLREDTVHNPGLPQLREAQVSLYLDNEMRTDTVSDIEDMAVFWKIPRKALGHAVRITVSCRNWIGLDTIIPLSRMIVLGMRRDESVYGDIHFRLWDKKAAGTIPNVPIRIRDIEAISGQDGEVHVTVPLADQDSIYAVAVPGIGVIDTIYMPSGDYDVVVIP